MRVKVICDRCGKEVDGLMIEATDTHPGCTAGFYLASAWQEYANPGEEVICDDCMWSDPRWQKDYGELPDHKD